tara:strand:- start:1968 stop:2888 length:921 start_codon:yes stop_codon:yes gene_type:complete
MENIMHFELQQSDNIVSLATSSVLVAVDVNVWSATKQDRVVSNEVTSAKKASAESGKFTKNLLANNVFHRDLMNYRQTIYTWLKRGTYRWNQGQDLLPVTELETFKQQYQEHESKFYELLENFCNQYSSIRNNMAFTQGDLFDINDYPSVDEIRTKFNCRLFVSEVPEQDFRCSVSQDTADDLKKQYQKQTEVILQNVIDQQTKSITEVMESIAHCCGFSEHQNAKGEVVIKKRKIYDTTITKAQEMCKKFKTFQPLETAESKKLVSAVVSLENVLNGVNIERLKESEVTRAEVQDEVNDILSKFN